MSHSHNARCLLFGAGGRLGRLCAEVLTELGVEYGHLRRGGDLIVAGSCIGNICDVATAKERYAVIDASIDHTSLAQMVAHENEKIAFFDALHTRGDLASMLAFSSGVVEFDDAQIMTAWHRKYRTLKMRLEDFVESLNVPFYCPRIFVVIGPHSFQAATTGWVDVVQQVCAGDRIGIGAPGEPRSWVAETFLRSELERFIVMPSEARRKTPLNGTFCLGDIARIVASQMNRAITFEPRNAAGWLSVPYVSREPPMVDPEYSLERILSPLAAAYAATLQA